MLTWLALPALATLFALAPDDAHARAGELIHANYLGWIGFLAGGLQNGLRAAHASG